LDLSFRVFCIFEELMTISFSGNFLYKETVFQAVIFVLCDHRFTDLGWLDKE
jgi:hypothetical protein